MKARQLSKKQAGRLLFRNNKLLPASRYTYASAVNSYFQFIIKRGLGNGFNIEHIGTWLSSFNSASTFNIRLQGIKEFYYKQFEGRSARDRLEMREAFETIRHRQPSLAKLPRRDYLTETEVNKLSKKLSKRMGLIVLALFWTGCRISELIHIRIEDCRSGDPVIILILGKGSKQRHVYLPKDLYDEIVKTFNSTTHLFQSKAENILSRVNVSNEMRRQSRRSFGLSVHPHMLRHSKAMYLKDVCHMSPDQIARALGHTRVITTLSFYMHDVPDAKAQRIPINKIKRGS